MPVRRLFAPALVALLVAPGAAPAQPPNQKGPTDRQKQLLASINWQQGPLDAKLGSVATVRVPGGYRFTDGAGARAYMEVLGNPPNPQMLGVLEPVADADQWLVEFSYEDVGYVKDDEKDNIDAAAILDSIKAGTAEANKQRARMGVPPLTIVGWETPPFYDTKTNRLSWAIRGQSEGQFVINYNTRLLGRGGVMSANLIVDPKDLPRTLPIYNELLTGYSYVPGQTYAEFRSGDKVAQYGLAALVAGGALAAAAKTGVLGKLLKPLLIGGALLIGVLAKFWKTLFGRKTQTEA